MLFAMEAAEPSKAALAIVAVPFNRQPAGFLSSHFCLFNNQPLKAPQLSIMNRADFIAIALAVNVELIDELVGITPGPATNRLLTSCACPLAFNTELRCADPDFHTRDVRWYLLLWTEHCVRVERSGKIETKKERKKEKGE